MLRGDTELISPTFNRLIYVIAGFSKNMGTTISGMTALYWKNVVFGFESRLVTEDLLSYNGRLPEVLFCGMKIV